MTDTPEFNQDKFKYKWTAFYSDGTKLSESEYESDVSKQPGCENRSAYYDIDHSRLIAFMITDGEVEYAVDLVSGHFLVNSIAFRMHSAEEEVKNFHLIWAKRNWHIQPGEHRVAFRIGWYGYDHEGRTVQQIMEID